MGLLIFKERAPDDRSPFRKNEFHVGIASRSSASNKSSFPTASDARTNTRSPIRRELTRRDRVRLRRLQRPHSANSAAEESFIEWLLPGTSPTSRAVIDYVMQDEPFENREESQRGSATGNHNSSSQIADSNVIPEPLRQEMGGSEVTRAQGNDSNMDSSVYAVPPSGIFPPARQFYETLQREQRFDVMRAQARTHTTNSRPGSPERVASPDTQQAILRQIENQSDMARFSRLYVDGVEVPATAPRMRISRSDGLGDRRRSPSNDDERPSSAEENWNSLMATIPPIDDNLPSASSSFASDSASSILSRNHPRSSLTNTSLGSRSASVEAATLRSLHCPETNDSSQTTTQRSYSSTPLLALPRTSSALSAEIRRSRSMTGPPANDSHQRRQSNVEPEITSHGLDNLDLMDMLNNGIEIPAEMWAGVGITPHLGLRGGASRIRR